MEHGTIQFISPPLTVPKTMSVSTKLVASIYERIRIIWGISASKFFGSSSSFGPREGNCVVVIAEVARVM